MACIPLRVLRIMHSRSILQAHAFKNLFFSKNNNSIIFSFHFDFTVLMRQRKPLKWCVEFSFDFREFFFTHFVFILHVVVAVVVQASEMKAKKNEWNYGWFAFELLAMHGSMFPSVPMNVCKNILQILWIYQRKMKFYWFIFSLYTENAEFFRLFAVNENLTHTQHTNITFQERQDAFEHDSKKRNAFFFLFFILRKR